MLLLVLGSVIILHKIITFVSTLIVCVKFVIVHNLNHIITPSKFLNW